MSDNEGGGRFGGYGRGQRTVEKVGGWDDIVIAVRNTIILALLAALEAAWALVLALIAGPWALLALVPSWIERVVRWVESGPYYGRDGGDDEGADYHGRAGGEPFTRLALVALALIPLAALLIIPEPLVQAVWPYKWQAQRVTWWGLLWPYRAPGMIAFALAVRATVLGAIVAAFGPVRTYLMQRLRQEIIAPTFSGAAFQSANPADVDIEGWRNPYLPQIVEADLPEPQRAQAARLVELNVRRPATAPAEGVAVGATQRAPLPAVEDGEPAPAVVIGDREFLNLDEVGQRPPLPFPLHLFEAGKYDAPTWAAWVLDSLESGTTSFNPLSGWRAFKGEFTSHTGGLELRTWLQFNGLTKEAAGGRDALTDYGRGYLLRVRAGEVVQDDDGE